MAPEAVLPSLVETVAESLRLPYVAVRVDTGQDTAGSTVDHGRLVGEPLCLPLVHQGAPVGELVLGPRTPGEGSRLLTAGCWPSWPPRPAWRCTPSG